LLLRSSPSLSKLFIPLFDEVLGVYCRQFIRSTPKKLHDVEVKSPISHIVLLTVFLSYRRFYLESKYYLFLVTQVIHQFLKYHYRKEWPWEASIFSRRPLCTAPETESHAAEPSSTATAPTATPPATSNEISCSACTFINPSHRSTCEMCETALPERPAVSVASQQQQRQRSEPTEERAQKRRVVEDTFDEVTLSPHLSPAFEATSAPPPTSTAAPAASTDVNDIFNTLFGTNPGSSAAKKHAKVNTSNPKQFRLPQPPVTVESRWKRLYFGKLKYEAQLFNRLDKTEDVLHSLQCTLR
jgi:hypothetical protein